MNISIYEDWAFFEAEKFLAVLVFFHAVSEKTISFLWFCSYIFPLFLSGTE